VQCSSMPWIAFSLDYPSCDPRERGVVAFPLPAPLWPNAEVTLTRVTNYFRDYSYLELVDTNGHAWRFHRGTVRAIATWDAAPP
jgi:hypothetical protein